jgi:hypothetical protein
LDPALATTEGGTGSDSYTPDAFTAIDVDQSTVSGKSRSGFVKLA